MTAVNPELVVVVKSAVYSGLRLIPGSDASRAVVVTVSVYAWPARSLAWATWTTSAAVHVHWGLPVHAGGLREIALHAVVGSMSSVNVIVKAPVSATFPPASAGTELTTLGGVQSIANTTEPTPFRFVESCAVT